MQLVKYDAACRAISECRRVDEVKDWIDKTAAIEAYGRMSRNVEIENDYAEVKLRAIRKLGELLIDVEKNTGSRGIGSAVQPPDRTIAVPTLANMGVSKNQSSQAQAIARIPAAQFEQTLSEHREDQKKVTATTMAKLNKQAADIPAPLPDENRLFDDLMASWQRATQSVKARFVEAIQREEWINSDPGTPDPNPTANVWTYYALAYHDRYGVEPVRNAQVNGQLSQLVKRIGGYDAPHVASFYVKSNTAFYVRCGHSVGQLLKDCEKLRTEWATNTRMTETQARQADVTQANGNVWGKLIAEAEAYEAGKS